MVLDLLFAENKIAVLDHSVVAKKTNLVKFIRVIYQFIVKSNILFFLSKSLHSLHLLGPDPNL